VKEHSKVIILIEYFLEEAYEKKEKLNREEALFV